MLDSQTLHTIERLVSRGALSQRAIARLVGVSRDSVNAIALGRRVEPLPPPPVRCPACGALVALPCRACAVRALDAPGKRPARIGGSEGFLALELHPKHHTRYLKVRAAHTETPS